jgi:hypothetical protein
MRWFRDNVRHGSWLALVALTINFALSFGHVHVAGRVSESNTILAALGLSDHDKAQGQSNNGHSDSPQADDLCPICLATSAIANAMAAAPPVLPLQLAVITADRAIVPVRLVIAQPRAPFQSRGPPAS